ncbi:MAG: sulfotransferase [Mariniblastus sp.]
MPKLKSISYWIDRAYRSSTSSFRMLPSFLILGAQKSGTTALFEYLTKHPDIVPPREKELYFFERNFPLGVDWYRSNFPFQKSEDIVTCEGSPFYLPHPEAPARVRQTFPNIKMLVVIRNPIERAWSQFKQNKKMNREPLSFDDAIAQENERNAKYLNDPSSIDTNFFLFSYAGNGMYAKHLKCWFDQFPREQILVLDAGNFYDNTPEVYREVLDFLNLKPFTDVDFSPVNALNRKREIGDRTFHYLQQTFRQPDQELCKLMGREFSWCKKGALAE